MQQEKILFRHPYFTIAESLDGDAYVQGGDNAVVVVLTPGNQVVLLAEPSPAFGERVLVLPGGSVEKNEDHRQTANRELQEEIGFKAKRLDFLGELRSDAKYNTQRVFVYLARDLKRSWLKGDERYKIRMGRVPLSRFEKLIARRRLVDANSIAALYMARSFLQHEGRRR